MCDSCRRLLATSDRPTRKAGAKQLSIKHQAKKIMTTLIEILTGSLSYDSSWAVYAQKIDGKFDPESPARFGQTCFENGGMLDCCEFFGRNDLIADSIQEWFGDFEPWDSHPHLWDSWVAEFCKAMDQAEILYGGDRRDISAWVINHYSDQYYEAKEETISSSDTED